jgi:hypothetical protein
MTEYPTRNPFPARGTSSGEESFQPEILHHWAEHTPTAPLPGVRGAERMAEEYVRGFKDEVTRLGGIGCLYGAHGVGKTHAARRMMARIDLQDSRTVQLYLRFQDDDFVAAYRGLASQLPQSLLTDLSLRYLGTLAGDRAEALPGPPGKGEIRSAVGEDPASVYTFFDAHVVEEGEVLEEQAKEIAAVAGGDPHFQRALEFLRRPEYSHAAYDWLCGRPISPEAALAIGVGGQINDPQTCRYGLQLLATLVTRGGRPFVLVLDQCEKFLLDDGVLVPRSLGILQSLAEVVPRVGGMLLLIVSEVGWERMPPDLRQRVGPGAYHMLPLTPEEAEMVLGVYMAAARQSADRDIWPITRGGLLELLRHSGGNIRLLLQLAWAAFEAKGARPEIDESLVATASARHRRFPTLSELAMTVEAKLLAAGLTAERAEAEGDATMSFHFPDRRTPRAVVKLSQAVFFVDEVSNAAEMIAVAQDVSADHGPVFTGLLVCGYVSPAVLDALRGAVHRVVVADGSATFHRRVDELMGEVSSAVAGRERGRQDPAALDSTLRELRLILEALSVERREEAAALSHNLAQVADRLAQEEPKGRSGWSARRDELTSRIAQARKDRAASDWEEFRNARQSIVRQRRTHIALVAAAVLVALSAVGLGAAISAATGSFAAFAAAAVVTAAAVVFVWFLVSRMRTVPVRRAAAPLESPRDLVRLARELRPHADPVSPDPAVRYAYALKEDPPGEAHGRLVEILLAEPLALVRQALGRHLAMWPPSPAECVDEVLRGMREDVAEVLLLVARRQPHAEPNRLPRTLRELPPKMRILVALANPDAPELADGALCNGPADAVLAALGVRGTGLPLARAFRSRMADAGTIDIAPNHLRAAAHLLSPFERDGLGSYDWLPLISEIDELFLFFEELLYYQDEIRSSRH